MHYIGYSEQFLRSVMAALKPKGVVRGLDPDTADIGELVRSRPTYGFSIDVITSGPAMHKIALQEKGGRTGRGKVYPVQKGEVYVSITDALTRFTVFATYRLERASDGSLECAEQVLLKTVCRDHAGGLIQIPACGYHDDSHALLRKLP